LPDAPEKDPIVGQSQAGWILIAALLLVATLGWALYDEFVGFRPWKDYQAAFVRIYSGYLHKELRKQEAAEKRLTTSSEYLALQQKAKDLDAQAQPLIDKINDQIALLNDQFTAINDQHTTARMYVGSRIYIIEHTSGEESKKKLLRELDEWEKGPFTVDLPLDNHGKTQRVSYNYQQLLDKFDEIQAQKSDLLKQEGEILHPYSEVKKQVASYVTDHLDGPTVDTVKGLLAKTDDFDIQIRQINNPDAGIVDRCESCHVGIREPLPLTKADMGGRAEFVSHPDMELLHIHDPEKFGCSPCHGGNGMNVQSVERAHGMYEEWTQPLFARENMEAGCQQCHARDMVVDHAPVLNQGKFLFEWRGCMGCHRYEGYDQSPEELVANERQLQDLETQRAAHQRDIQRAIQAGDQAPDNATAQKFYLQANELQVSISKIDLQMDQLDRRAKYLMMGEKKVGPDLKEVGVKIHPDWIPVWLSNPHAWRPATRMPRFRFDEDELQAVSAFIWQDAIKATLPHQAPGDPVKGKQSFETRGCMGCHSIGEGANRVGGWFAANLTRVGEKDNYDYLVRWIHNPRERTEPYCPYEKRDLTAEDYKKHGLPFVFDLEHSKCPNDGQELVVEQETIMPNLRLAWGEARNIASYLETLKEKEPSSYASAPYLNDPKLAVKGKAIVRQYGCAGCHEIAGLEDATRIGTELTKEGSKPLAQIDFALFRRQAQSEGWFNPKGFFERKLAVPEIWDTGMIKAEGEELKMPDFFETTAPFNAQKAKDAMPQVAPEAHQQIEALTTFLLGSVTSEYPERYFYEPSGPAKDIQEGWWIVKKYNCEGCHQFTLGQSSVLMSLPQYQTPDGKSQLPPRLLTEGARVNPRWLERFLANPALSDTNTDHDGVRSYLKVRMPTFYLSPVEIRKLVRFFQALSQQPMPYIPRTLEPLTAQETAMARALFTSQAAPCLKCHAIGLPAHDQYATAPNFLLAAQRLKPDWVRHWILDPALIDPGTAMPSGLFRQAEGHWVFAGPTPSIFKGYNGDQAELLVRYLFELTPQEQQRLIQMSGRSLMPAAAKPATTELRRKSVRGSTATLLGMLTKAH
jgi:cytochrome c551/c552